MIGVSPAFFALLVNSGAPEIVIKSHTATWVYSLALADSMICPIWKLDSPKEKSERTDMATAVSLVSVVIAFVVLCEFQYLA